MKMSITGPEKSKEMTATNRAIKERKLYMDRGNETGPEKNKEFTKEIKNEMGEKDEISLYKEERRKRDKTMFSGL